MSDNFERVKTEILHRVPANGGPTALDLLEAIEATNEDNDEGHEQIIEGLNEHLKVAEKFFARVENLEAYQEDAERNCATRAKQLWKSQHEPIHAEHMVTMHKLDEEAYDIKKLYRMVKWAVVVIGGGILVILADQIGNFIFGGAT